MGAEQLGNPPAGGALGTDGLVRRLRLLSQPQHLGAGSRRPVSADRIIGSADGTGLGLMVLVMGEGGAQQLRQAPGPSGIRRGNRLQLLLGHPQVGQAGVEFIQRRGREARKRAQHPEVARTRLPEALELELDRVEVDRFGFNGCEHSAGAVVVNRLQRGLHPHRLVARCLDEPIAREPRIAQVRRQFVDVLEAEDRRQGVVHRAELVEHLPELVEGEKRPVARHRLRPAQRVERCVRSGAGDYPGLALGQGVVGVPRAAQHRRARLALDLQPRLERGPVALMQVAPALRPDLRAAQPARVRARQQQLEPLGEGRLARPVASGDQRQAGPRLHVQRDGRPDPAEAANLDRRQVDAEIARLQAELLVELRSRGRHALDGLLQLGRATAGRQHEVLRTLVEIALGETLDHQGLQNRVHCRKGTDSGRPRCRGVQRDLGGSTIAAARFRGGTGSAALPASTGGERTHPGARPAPVPKPTCSQPITARAGRTRTRTWAGLKPGLRARARRRPTRVKARLITVLPSVPVTARLPAKRTRAPATGPPPWVVTVNRKARRTPARTRRGVTSSRSRRAAVDPRNGRVEDVGVPITGLTWPLDVQGAESVGRCRETLIGPEGAIAIATSAHLARAGQTGARPGRAAVFGGREPALPRAGARLRRGGCAHRTRTGRRCRPLPRQCSAGPLRWATRSLERRPHRSAPTRSYRRRRSAPRGPPASRRAPRRRPR